MKFFELFKEPTLEELVAHELAQAERELLMVETSLAKARCLVAYNEDRITRLTAHAATTMGRPGTAALSPLRPDTPIRADIAPTMPSASGAHQTGTPEIDAANVYVYVPNKGWDK